MREVIAIEIISVILNVVFLILLIQENKQCWFYGIGGSMSGAYVFFENAYYSETILYVFYACVGVYGYYYWEKTSHKNFRIKTCPWWKVGTMIIGAFAAGIGLGYVMTKTDASEPYYDAMSTVFGILATFLELYKYFIAWGFWIVINAYTIWLYGIKDLNFLALQMILYTGLSIYGLFSWYNKLGNLR